MQNNNEFITENIFPVRIVCSNGKISDKEALLNKKDLQITTNENEITTLSNFDSDENAYIILDFGKEYNGAIRILTYTTSGKQTPAIRITYGESVSEALSDVGYKNSTNDHTIRDFNFNLTSYSDMTFTESGLRFVKIELLDKNTEIRLKSVVLQSRLRKLTYEGSFKCNDEIINKIYETSAYTCHLCMQQYIWDGIKRDRLVWIGDMHPEMLTVRSVFGANPIIPESLRFMRNQTPLPAWMNGMPTYSIWWLHILSDWYTYTGDDDFLNENRDYAVSLIKIIIKLINDDGTDNLPEYFLDWPCNNKPQSVSGSRALLAMSLDSCAKLCEVFNELQLQKECIQKKQFITSTELVSFGAKQVTAIAALASWTDPVESGKEVLQNGAAGWSTFMSYYLLKCGSYYNMADTLEAMKQYYGAMLRLGATTFWEDFDINWSADSFPINEIPDNIHKDVHGDFGKFCYSGLRHSLCHGWSSGPVAFLAEEVLGIKILENGCRKILLEPDPANLTFVQGTYPTPFGNIEVKIEVKDNIIRITYSAPKAISIITKEKFKEYNYEFYRIS